MTNSSMRVKIGATVLNDYINFKEYKSPSQSSTAKKRHRLHNLQSIVIETQLLQRNMYKEKIICFDPNIQINSNTNCKHQKYYPMNGMDIIDTTNGIQCNNTEGVLQFLLLPRGESLKQMKKRNIMQSLKFLSKNRPQLKRGTERMNYFYDENHSYVIFGTSPNRYGRGSIENSLKNDPNDFYKNRIMKLMRNIERKIEMYLDIRLLQSLSYVKNELLKYDTTKTSNKKHNKIWCAISHAVNYNSATHVDEDFFLSACSINEDDNEDEYKKQSKVCTYFCFPTLKKAVSMRDGDILLFNPLTYHCCSKKKDGVKNDLHIYSLYLKSKQVSLNDNSIQLTPKQQGYLSNLK